MPTENPRILVFAGSMAYLGADNAGLLHKEYPSSSFVVKIPCTTLVRPDMILYALQNGFDGVFVASSGPDCPYLADCVERTAKRVESAYKLLESNGLEPERIQLAGICSVCSDAFANNIKELHTRLKKLEPAGRKGSLAAVRV